MALLFNRATDLNDRNVMFQNQNEEVSNSLLSFKLLPIMVFKLHRNQPQKRSIDFGEDQSSYFDYVHYLLQRYVARED